MATRALIVTCEHATQRVPPELAQQFAGRAARAALASHRGWDPGAIDLARQLARRYGAPLFEASVSRLVVDTNRSPGHPRLFSEFTRQLPEADRRQLTSRYHAPHQDAVFAAVERLSRRGATILHLAMHSFTPWWEGQERTTDVGILYDPRRAGELAFASRLQRELRAVSEWRVHKNAPYRGVADGLPTLLRKHFGPRRYVGLELEVNQRWFGEKTRRATLRSLLAALHESLAPTRGQRP
ncbi:MAG TPA: N-formylglutamate amidohydrolase [Polyangiaceae bacterium]|nr:N-formylglutamate amidohydrolase [Polyangiaceae bacterium]